MESKKNEPIRLSEDETEMLTRALLEAQAQAEGPKAVDSDTQQLYRRAADRKVGDTQQVQGPKGPMVI
jgi:hypothetical protein